MDWDREHKDVYKLCELYIFLTMNQRKVSNILGNKS